ncbi:MAG: hypothetical protein IT276_07950 [Ignavibacteriaceae bacterium]|nr:hypothetical protein [Ignavibacteriaceae bacterium]
MLNDIKIGDKYYSIRILPDKAEPYEYINQNSNLEIAVERSGNYFKTRQECQELCDRINLAIKKTKATYEEKNKTAQH